MGNKGNLVLGSNQVVPEMHGDPVNQIPRFIGHPIGGPVYSDTKPVPWIEAQAGTGGRGGRGAGAGGGQLTLEEQMFVCQQTRLDRLHQVAQEAVLRPGMGHRTASICNLGNMSLRLGGRTIHWDPEKEVVMGDKEAAAMCNRALPGALGWRAAEHGKGVAEGRGPSVGKPFRAVVPGNPPGTRRAKARRAAPMRRATSCTGG